MALLLFGSGLCALVYQTTWLREFRLIFGATTAASGAVLAIFMAGLGFGSALLGKRADKKNRPLLFYGQLELLIGLSAAVTPVLVWLVRQAYVAIGGTPLLGLGWGTMARLGLSVLVLAFPTFLMGGTLPAAVRAVERAEDQERRRVALLYGANTAGAVTGTLFSTFYLFEHLGNRMSLWLACALNICIALAAQWLAKGAPVQEAPEGQRDEAGAGALAKSVVAESETRHLRRLVLLAACLVGFVFLLMEIVWYRMLTPLLGGTTFTFGLILAIALLGVGIGSGCFMFWAGRRVPGIGAFAVTCMLEALFLAYPLALGDRVAIVTILLRPLGLVEFYGHVVGWTIVTSIIVLPAAMMAGFQFPLLISLLGKGERAVGEHTGLAYAWNTVGAIGGSLAGGFGLLPLLSAPGAWRLAIGILLLLGFASLIYSWRRDARGAAQGVSVASGAAALLMMLSIGPTAVWRHSPIGVGRVELADLQTRNRLRDWMGQTRHSIVWQRDGRESCVGVDYDSSYSFIVNGKVDGNARFDAGTQVLSGLVGAIVHPNPRTVLVVGLGTGSTAGWLGAVPGIERVDVVELEPSIRQVARMCSAVNQNVLSNPKVHIMVGDGREVLLTSRKKYDLIVSEPSNLYRAGVAGLFTRDFYAVVASRLNKDGLFLQWLQAYETDYQTVRTAYATLSAVFGSVDTWLTLRTDLLFVSSLKGISYDADVLRARVGQEPFTSALRNIWRVTDLEGFFARYLCNEEFARSIANLPGNVLNTDDRNVLEYAFARSVGRAGEADPELLRNGAWDADQEVPVRMRGQINWAKVEARRRTMLVLYGRAPKAPPPGMQGLDRVEAYRAYIHGELQTALSFWRRLKNSEPQDLVELAMVAECLSDAGEEEAASLIAKLRTWRTGEADALLGRLHLHKRRQLEAATAFESAFRQLREDPWADPSLMRRTIASVEQAAPVANREFNQRMFKALAQPFAASCNERDRQMARFALAKALEGDAPGLQTLEVVQAFEPNVPWKEGFLKARAKCYARLKHPLAAAAELDLKQYLRNESPGLLPAMGRKSDDAAE